MFETVITLVSIFESNPLPKDLNGDYILTQ